MPPYSPQRQRLQKRHFSLKGAVVERFYSGTKPFPVSGKHNLRFCGPLLPFKRLYMLQISGVNKQNLTLHGATKGYFNNGLRTRTRTQWTREDMKGRKPFLFSSPTRPNSHISRPLQMHRLQISGVNKQALAYRGAPRGCFKKRFLDVKGLVVYAVSDKKKMLQTFCPEP